jgi:zinc ribbon protein
MEHNNHLSLKKCPACQNSVSSEAIKCPQCGHPINKESNPIQYMIGGIGLFILSKILLFSGNELGAIGAVIGMIACVYLYFTEKKKSKGE